ncbi:MAG: efflux RND transporter periplasmic adaptor subunit [Deltaproteobacteria bacterium]|nr:efflux RND transporter periplasmic adaptor subunit [Deltaproteobacteria bacterium]
MKKIARATGLCLLSLLLGACSPSSESSGPPEPPPKAVRVMEIRRDPIPIVAEAVGRLVPNREVTLAAEISGVVAEYSVDTGDRVQEDSILVRLDPVDYQLALKEAEANFSVAQTRLDLALKAYNRSKNLLPRKVITQDAFDRAESEYLSARASLERLTVLVDIAKARLAKTRVHAPFNGHVAARMIETGQMIGAGQPLMKIVDANPMRVKIWLPEKGYVHLDKSDPVSIVVEAFPASTFTGTIDRIDIVADEKTNTFGVEILLDNTELLLKAGMSARVQIVTGLIPDAILIPQSTVLYRSDREEVFIAGPDNRAILRQIEPGLSAGDKIEIRKGLSEGDQLIVTGGQFLEPGDKILISAFTRTAEK